MRYYHGSGQFDQIMKEGLVLESGNKTDFDDTGALTSLGGIYMTDRVDVASFYATKATTSECSLGMDPCVFVLEVDEDTLIADEDKIWSVIRNDFEFGRLGFDDGDDAELHETFDAALAKNSHVFKRLMSDICVEDTDENYDAFVQGVRAFVLRAYSWEWSEENCQAEFEAINKLCDLARSTVSHDWMARNFTEYAITCRTMDAVSADPSSGGNRIVGAICLRMNSDGLKIEDIEAVGDVTKSDVKEFVAAFKEKVGDITGCRVTGGTGKFEIKEFPFQAPKLGL